MKNFDLIFHNNGGITLQADDYFHYFSGREKEAADLVDRILEPGTELIYWDGCEYDCAMVYDPEVERSGGYSWMDERDVVDAIALSESDRELWLMSCKGEAKKTFFKELFARRDKFIPW